MSKNYISKSKELESSTQQDELLQLFEECENEIQIWKKKYEKSVEVIKEQDYKIKEIKGLKQENYNLQVEKDNLKQELELGREKQNEQYQKHQELKFNEFQLKEQIEKLQQQIKKENEIHQKDVEKIHQHHQDNLKELNIQIQVGLREIDDLKALNDKALNENELLNKDILKLNREIQQREVLNQELKVLIEDIKKQRDIKIDQMREDFLEQLKQKQQIIDHHQKEIQMQQEKIESDKLNIIEQVNEFQKSLKEYSDIKQQNFQLSKMVFDVTQKKDQEIKDASNKLYDLQQDYQKLQEQYESEMINLQLELKTMKENQLKSKTQDFGLEYTNKHQELVIKQFENELTIKENMFRELQKTNKNNQLNIQTMSLEFKEHIEELNIHIQQV